MSEQGAAYDPLGNYVSPVNPQQPGQPPPATGMYGPGYGGAESTFGNANNFSTGCMAASNNPQDCTETARERMSDSLASSLPGYHSDMAEFERRYEGNVGYIFGGGDPSARSFWGGGASSYTTRWDEARTTLYITDTSTVGTDVGELDTAVEMLPLLQAPQNPLPGFDKDQLKDINKAITEGAKLLQKNDCQKGLAAAGINVSDVNRIFGLLSARPASNSNTKGYDIFYAEKSTDPQVQQFLQDKELTLQHLISVLHLLQVM